MERARKVAEGVYLARDLVNEPPNLLTPEALAERARELEALGVEVEVLDEKAIAELGMGAFLAVAQGSENPPRFIKLRYSKEGARARLDLVGKGLTFDSGGYSLKPTEGMTTMKGDMAGAAAVLGAFKAAALLGLPVELRGYIAACENLISGRAYRVGDVLKTLSGKTVEVMNTDARAASPWRTPWPTPKGRGRSGSWSFPPSRGPLWWPWGRRWRPSSPPRRPGAGG